MDIQYITIDAGTGSVTMSNVSRLLPALSGILGTRLRLSASFARSSEIITHEVGTTGRLTLKAVGRPSGEPLGLDTAWQIVDDRYVFETALTSGPLYALLGDQKDVVVSASVEWQIPGETEPRKSLDFPILIVTSSSREDDVGPPPQESAAWAWIKSRLVAGPNITFSVNESAKTITINGPTPGTEVTAVNWEDIVDKPSFFATTWGLVTGKPTTFPPSSHTHTWGQISGNPAYNEGLAAYVAANAGGRTFDVLLKLPLLSSGEVDLYGLDPVFVMARAGEVYDIDLIFTGCQGYESGDAGLGWVWGFQADFAWLQDASTWIDGFSATVHGSFGAWGSSIYASHQCHAIFGGTLALPKGASVTLLTEALDNAYYMSLWNAAYLRIRGRYTA